MQGRPNGAAFFMRKNGAGRQRVGVIEKRCVRAGLYQTRRSAHQLVDLAGDAIPLIGIGRWINTLIDIGPLLG
ncbi:hypothetical protein GCM10010082_02180 [Kushneria pakistanensis]|uniref:Transposase n=1 Tax=Kushneria pakistanensis TaxID=1508770 RepID=A0ABQ3F9X1_9GAMM|nr:hypothetical protein GCM10010082_02180 [Kushneria pakistanensis]